VQLTIDSTEPLESVLAVLGSVYQLQLSAGPRTDASTVSASDSTGAGKKVKTSPVAGRSSTAAGGSRRSRRDTAAAVDPSAVRGWARDNDMAVSVRGRIPAGLLSAYRDAHA